MAGCNTRSTNQPTNQPHGTHQKHPPAHHAGWMDGWMDDMWTESTFSLYLCLITNHGALLCTKPSICTTYIPLPTTYDTYLPIYIVALTFPTYLCMYDTYPFTYPTYLCVIPTYPLTYPTYLCMIPTHLHTLPTYVLYLPTYSWLGIVR
jgi:hypothetical protein